jgi:gliding motility-associated-like protein
MKTNLSFNLLGFILILIFILIFPSISGSNFALSAPNAEENLVAVAGNDTTVGLCGIKLLDGSASTGNIVGYQWTQVDNSQLVNMSPTDGNQPMILFQAFMGGTYTFTLTVTDDLGNTDVDTIVYNIMDIKAEVLNDVSIGGCKVLMLDATKESTVGEGYTFEWYPANKVSDPASASPTFTPSYTDYNKTISFYFTVRDNYGCEAVDEFKVKVGNVPVAAINGNAVKVNCDTLLLDASWSDGDAITYAWFPSSGVAQSTTSPFQAKISNEIERAKVVVTDKFGCSDSAEFVLGNNRFFVALGDDVETGNCITQNISVNGAFANTNYSWNTSNLAYTAFNNNTQVRITANTIRVALAQDTTRIFPVSFTASRNDGCVKSDTMLLKATNTQFYINAGPDELVGSCGTRLKGSVNSDFFSTVTWTGNVMNQTDNVSKANQLTPFVTFPANMFNTAQTLTLRSTDIFGCNKADVVRITIDRAPIITANPKTYTSDGCLPVQLNATSLRVDSISWTPALFVDNPHILSPYFKGSASVNLQVNGYDKYGCVSSDNVSVTYAPITANAGTDKVTTQYAPVMVGSGKSVAGFTNSWKLLTPDANVTLENSTSALCKFTSKAMGSYTLVLTFANNTGCVYYDTARVTVNFGNLPPVFQSISATPQAVYAGDSMQFSLQYVNPDNDPVTVKWTIEGKEYNFQQIKVPVFKDGWAVASLSDLYATIKDSVRITITPRTPVVINSLIATPSAFFRGDVVSVVASASSVYDNTVNYNWNIDGQTYTTSSVEVSIDKNKWAVLSVSDRFTTAKDSVYLQFIPEEPVGLFTVGIVPNDTVCAGSTVSVNITPSGNKTERLKYQTKFSNNIISTESSFSFVPTSQGYLTVKVYNNDYSLSDSVELFVVSSQVENRQLRICKGDILAYNPDFSYRSGDYSLWNSTGLLSQGSVLQISSQQAGSLWVTQTNLYGCNDTLNLNVATINTPVALDEDVVLEKGLNTVMLDVSLNDTAELAVYQIVKNSLFADTRLSLNGMFEYEIDTFLFKTTDTIIYRVSPSECYNLSDTAEVRVFVNNIPNVSKDIINAFSPNGDGINDFFEIERLYLYPENELFVYDKAGALVYYKNRYDNTWDGRRNRGISIGRQLPPATYFYVFEAQGQSIVNGFVELRR